MRSHRVCCDCCEAPPLPGCTCGCHEEFDDVKAMFTQLRLFEESRGKEEENDWDEEGF